MLKSNKNWKETTEIFTLPDLKEVVKKKEGRNTKEKIKCTQSDICELSDIT